MTREEKMNAAWNTVKGIIYDTIKESPDGAPSGHIYAALMGYMSLDVYNKMLSELKAEGKISEKYHLLTAI